MTAEFTYSSIRNIDVVGLEVDASELRLKRSSSWT